MKKLFKTQMSKLGLLLSVILLTSNVQAAKVSGKVIDESGTPLFNVYVFLFKGEKRVSQALTDFDGRYELQAPQGTYRLRATTIGKDTFMEEITLVEGSILEKDLVMTKKSSKTTKRVVFTKKRDNSTSNAVLLKKKNSSGVVDGISKEQFSQAGDGNVSQGVKRVTGVTVENDKYITVRGLGDRYTKGLLNGTDIPSPDPMKNSVQMDIFPSNVIDNVLIYKAFTPDLPGDFSGGLIDVVTRDFPTKPTFSFSISGSHNPNANFNSDFATFQGGNMDALGIDDGYRDLPTGANNIPGRFSDPAGNKAVGTSFNNDWEMQTKTPFLNTSFSTAFGNKYKLGKRDFGFISSLTYSHSFSRYEGGQANRWSVPSAQSSEELNPEMLYDFQRSQEAASWSAMVGGTLKLNKKNKVGVKALYSHSGTKEAKKLEGNWFDQASEFFVSQAQLFKERSFANFQFSGKHLLSDSSRWQAEWVSGFTTGGQNNPDNKYFQYEYDEDANGNRVYEMNTNYSDPTRLYQKMDEVALDNKLHITKPFKFKRKFESKFKFGGAYSMKSRDFKENRYDFPDANGSLLTSVNGDLKEFFNPANADPSNGWYVEDGSELRNSYEASQNIAGGYAMVDVAVRDKMKVITGARVESMNLEVTSDDPNNPKGNIAKTDILPSLQVKLEPNDKTRVRFGYGRTVARPTFREIAPFTTFSFDQPPVKGNPQLDRSTINNFDFRWERYPTVRELVSFSLFYKQLNNPIGQAFVPEAANAEIQMVNLPSANVFGAEFEVRKTFLNPFSKKKEDEVEGEFTAGFNATYIYSVSKIDEAELQQKEAIDPSTKDTRPLYGQSPYMINAMLGYKNDSTGTSINVSFNVFGKRLVIASQAALPDIYEQPRPALDVVIGQKLTERFKLTLKGRNLLNPETKLSHEFKGNEFIYTTWRNGSSVSLGLSYKF